MIAAKQPLALVGLGLAVAIFATAAQATIPKSFAWPQLPAEQRASGASGNSYPQFALVVENGELVAGVATGEQEADDGDRIRLIDQAGKEHFGILQSSATLLGTARPVDGGTLDDIMVTADDRPPPPGFEARAVPVEYVVSVGPDGQLHDVLVLGAPSPALAEKLKDGMFRMHFAPYKGNPGESARWMGGRMMLDPAIK